MKLKKTTLLLSAIVIIFSSCIKDTVDQTVKHYSDDEYAKLSVSLDLPQDAHSYEVLLPDFIRNSGVFPRRVNDDKAILGRVLFYDTKLSKNNSISCQDCHKQSLAFSDDVAQSKGFDDKLTHRNSLALGAVVNFSAYYGDDSNFGSGSSRFFWDERAGSVSEQSRQTIQDNIEMGMPLNELVDKIKDEPHYQVLFNRAFDGEISETTILEALSDFINAMGSFNSKFDQAAVQEGSFISDFSKNFSGLTAAENEGKALFMENCASCHGREFARPPKRIANNGLDVDYSDNGVGEFENDSTQDGVFKVPSLRNVELTGPYMHDGRFETLEDVVDHYSEGIQNHRNLDQNLSTFDFNQQKFVAKQMNFTNEQKDALVSFLKTLTDESFLTEEKFSNPFK